MPALADVPTFRAAAEGNVRKPRRNSFPLSGRPFKMEGGTDASAFDLEGIEQLARMWGARQVPREALGLQGVEL